MNMHIPINAPESESAKILTRREWLARIGVATAAWSLWPRAWAAEAPSPTQDEPGTLREAMHRAGGCLLAWLDPKRHFLPTGGYQASHDTGRWWDAMLRLHATTGFAIPPQVETAMLENFRVMTDNPAGLLANDERLADLKGTAQANPHNFRESMLAYSALVRHRHDDGSRRQGRRLVETTGQLLESDGQMDYARLAALMKMPLNPDPSMIQRSPAGRWFDATGTTGRAIEGFVSFHQATKDDRALKLAARLAKIHLRNVVRPDGKIPPEILDRNNVGHNHSYLGTLRGLLLFGLATGNKRYVEVIARTYRNGLFGTVITESGWSPHDLGKSRFPNGHGDPVGEHASCSDVVQLALWLALKAGHTDLLDDVERLIRARLLPSQITDPNDPRRNGAWGAYDHPYGTGSIIDVIAAVLHVLTEVYQSIVTRSASGTVTVNLHFTVDTAVASVRAFRGERGRTRVILKQAGRLRIRVPGWTPRATVRLSAAGKPLPLKWDGNYLSVTRGAATAGVPVELEYDLPQRNTVETMPVSRRQFRLTWRGDEVVACDPEGPIYSRKR